MLAIGGDLSPQRLIQAYSQGIFPWFEPGSPILWWSPDPRLILWPNNFRISRSLRQTLKKPFQLTVDNAFKEVIIACATNKERLNNTWITPAMIEAYEKLHQMGYAHSFEVWLNDELVGGLYGVSLGHAFFGESMFHKERDASKVAMYFLCSVMKSWQFDFIDCQLPTAHLQRMGAETVPRKQFLDLLRRTLRYPNKQEKWVYSSHNTIPR
ncbi:leucyl/phenylalanyl-tRNA--protein transferase [Legionella israelensis]|uniref:Leucyl/phenylalanyl-tRNA--protein transferase n=1 Tax=Legionella israelensis TaxID=454 RepID=A0A0W0VL18_9GAMM|nr:leucyl/phenylalanyl-tRNA--protein transferase [Legionella israelensis]SCX86514.1 leucyl/phenylalanyl-tRNA--protein transferase [Legionella israelensis DSM 19235]STX57813.1 leucyl/phenylalanyl-tRNA--protein transferase [Legionella israelensis]